MSEPPRHWFEDLADHMGPAYLRYSFTRGTADEVGFLVETLGLEPGSSPVLDLGCGPGRHCLELAKRGIATIGVDISETFIDVARQSAHDDGVEQLATFLRADVTNLAGVIEDRSIGAVIAMCQGGFGIADPQRHRPGQSAVGLTDPFNLGHDRSVLAEVSRVLEPGGSAAISAFSAYFQTRWIEESDTFDAKSAINHEITEVMNSSGDASTQNLWTTCYTPRELALLADGAGLDVIDVLSVAPGSYKQVPAGLESQEFLLLATLRP